MNATERPQRFHLDVEGILWLESLLKTAAALHRLPLLMRMFAMLPDNPTPPPSRPWGGVCVLGRNPVSPS